jgi:hypothetical protein
MPEEIVRSYLVNPFLYNSRTFCCGCNNYVESRELIWRETGESLEAYRKNLQEAYVKKHGGPPPKMK